jgi:hypothetical protein
VLEMMVVTLDSSENPASSLEPADYLAGTDHGSSVQPQSCRSRSSANVSPRVVCPTVGVEGGDLLALSPEDTGSVLR